MGATVLMLGDSITDGTGATTTDLSYVIKTRELCKDLGKYYNLVVQGFPSMRSDQILTNYQRRLKNIDADIITILCGTNDISQSITDSAFKTNLTNLVKEIKRNKSGGQCTIVLCSILWRNDASNSQVPTFNTRVQEVATEQGVLFCDTYTSFSSAASMYDAVHPNDSGHLAVATTLSNYINGLSVWSKVGKR
jgi:lysophospholipase L1-like esterase